VNLDYQIDLKTSEFKDK